MNIAPEVQKELSQAARTKRLCYVLELDGKSALGAAMAMRGRDAKRAAIRQELQRVKAPVLGALKLAASNYQDLAGTGQVVIAAEAKQWREVLALPEIKRAKGRIIPNELLETHD